MKKTNIILTAIGLLSVIGGAFAFKAQHRFGGTLFCYTTVGKVSGLIRIYTPVRVRYTADVTGATMFCTVGGPNTSYHLIKVELNL